MTYNVFGGMLNLTQPATVCRFEWSSHRLGTQSTTHVNSAWLSLRG